jgi:hypothetical protein
MLADQNTTLDIMFPECFSSYQTIDGAFRWGPANGYTLRLAEKNVLFIETTIDMIGYSMDYMTFAAFDTQYQDPGIYNSKDVTGGAPSTVGSLQVMELVSTNPISDVELVQLSNEMNRKSPGMLGTDQNFKQMIYGRYSLYCPNNNLALIGFMQLISSQGFGSKEPTASDKLWCYRIIVAPGATNGDTIQIPACRIGLKGRLYHESEAAYVMRLRRNLLLQQNTES